MTLIRVPYQLIRLKNRIDFLKKQEMYNEENFVYIYNFTFYEEYINQTKIIQKVESFQRKPLEFKR